ncbi:hypothetical protein [Lichenihabitans psoromatis]|uniref:hypothetical protein n=1 Tax=Lichenihabitans psoromatis TaxID=2528642 RepID=UPI001036DAD2|nr:hypothetical protein [Lichenihabitans psoromatis]
MPRSYCLHPLFVLPLLVIATVPAAAAFECPAAGTKPSLATDEISTNDPSVSRSVMTAIDRLREQGLKSGEIIDHLVIA